MNHPKGFSEDGIRLCQDGKARAFLRMGPETFPREALHYCCNATSPNAVLKWDEPEEAPADQGSGPFIPNFPQLWDELDDDAFIPRIFY